MKKQYTKKQIQEAIAYWRKQLDEGNYRKIGESGGEFDREDFFIDLKDRVTADPALEGMFGDAYRRLDPRWNGDMNDDGYLDWEYDFLMQAVERAEKNGGGLEPALAGLSGSLAAVGR